MTPKLSPMLGIDPGIARLGWAVVNQSGQQTKLVDAGLLTTPAKQAMPMRLMKQAKEFRALIKKYKPVAVSLEQVFFTTNVSTALITSQVRGMLLLVAAEHGLLINEFTPTAIKLAVTDVPLDALATGVDVREDRKSVV